MKIALLMLLTLSGCMFSHVSVTHDVDVCVSGDIDLSVEASNERIDAGNGSATR